MKLECPLCGGKFELERANRDATFRQILEMAHRFGDRGRLVWEYLDCYRQGQRPLPPKTELRLAGQLWDMWEKGEFSYNRKLYRFSRPHLLEALELICNKQLCGLQNHNYLKKIIIGWVGKDEGQAERQAEATKSSGYRDLMTPSPIGAIERKAAGPAPAAEEQEELIPMPPKVAEELKKIGKKMPE